ncbi:MAG: hypothetical protein ACRCZZ_05670, partial [Phocaeicola sp.]
SHHALTTLKSLGMQDGIHYKVVSGGFQGGSDFCKKFFADVENSNTSNPLGLIKRYKERIADMVEEEGSATSAGIIAWGKGGTGKSHHALTTLKSLGMQDGIHYKVVSGGFQGGSEGLIGSLYDWREFIVVIVDDADGIFKEAYRPLMLNVLQSDAKSRNISVNAKIKAPSGAVVSEDFNMGETKYIFCTNKNVASMDNAFKSRLESFNFDFTDEEMLILIKDSLDRMLPSDPNLTSDVKLKIYNLVDVSSKKGVLKRVDFRLMTQCLKEYSLAINRGRDAFAAVAGSIGRAV